MTLDKEIVVLWAKSGDSVKFFLGNRQVSTRAPEPVLFFKKLEYGSSLRALNG